MWTPTTHCIKEYTNTAKGVPVPNFQFQKDLETNSDNLMSCFTESFAICFGYDSTARESMSQALIRHLTLFRYSGQL